MPKPKNPPAFVYCRDAFEEILENGGSPSRRAGPEPGNYLRPERPVKQPAVQNGAQ